MEPFGATATQYATFARQAADSPVLASWSAAVAGDPELLALVDTLPGIKRQPNLVLAAARWHGLADDAGPEQLRELLLARWPQVAATVATRSTQTNEVGRLATLLPALAQCGQGPGGDGPLALLKVGASAGLCLYPDRYDYSWSTSSGTRTLTGSGGPQLTCRVEGDPPLPTRHPRIGWRGGIDLNPLDVTDDDSMRWLELLVWPGQDDRVRRLRAAVDIARADPPHLVRGDLMTELPRLLDRAAEHGTPVVLHSAVIVYLEAARRREFVAMMRQLVADGACRWISNEGPEVLSEVTDTHVDRPDPDAGFVLGVDGTAVAWTHGHGAGMRWL